ncbi:hypothetical protein SAMN05216559_4192 [Halomicrobium zhouii]|uniref:Hsp20/alpha crystallin family protein n=1 Tax=Halomicrobium zhouii TaxID=767519 RepID=A0A1I6MBK8_9EURY|nr:hypothetical protein [Halomicrobium zhouii]SFS13074.1 hypothetical protein SAMN05216559_4192 [Halomicrobium zhouii]
MDAPHQLRTAADEHDDVSITHREFEETAELTVDFGADAHASVDVVGDTAIVVADGEQYEFEVPEEATEVTTNDGMLIIRSDR